MSDISQRVAHLSAQQRQLLALRLQQEKERASRPFALLERRAEAGKPVPLSFAQQRLWFLHQLDPDSTAYNVPLPVRLRGHLRVDLLEQALQEMVVRHEALRTLFVSQHDQPVQLVQPAPPLVLPLIDLCAWPPSEREALAGTLIATDLQRPFVLSHDLLLRALLVRLSDGEHILLLTLHHIAFDGWSTQIFLRELTQLYTAFLHGLPSPLPALPLRYADFALWQRELLQGPEYLRLARYWKEQLHAAPPLLALPTDRPRPATQSLRGAAEMLMLSTDLTQALQSFCRQEGVTLFMGLLTLFALLLWRYSDQQDLLIGTPIANRTHTQTEGLLGFFANTLVLRIRLQPPLSFRQLLAQVRETALQAYSHQDMPFEQLVEELNPVRQLAYNPLFQVLFGLQTVTAPILSLPGLSVRVEPFEGGSAKFDLSLAVLETAEELHLACEYATDLFEPPTIRRLLQQYRTLLRSALAQPAEAISRLSLLPPEELHLLLSQWNQTQMPFPQECIHEQIARQAACTPDAIALVHEQAQLSYRLLDQCSNQLAHYLQCLGVGPEVCVGVFLERSIPLVIALLAVLKAGGAYVPLDASYPKGRLAFLIRDSQVSILLTNEHLHEQIALLEHPVPILSLDKDWEQIASASGTNPSSNVTSGNLAYIIYTSGSTGTPKGVAITHRALINHHMAFSKHFNLQPNDRVLQFASFGFDASVEEIFPTLLSGATLILRTDEILNVKQFLHFIEENCLTVLDLPTAYWHVWVYRLASDIPSPPPDLRLVIVGGEEATHEKLVSWQQWSKQLIRWANTYGPTEATITASIYEPGSARQYYEKHTLPIGRPLSNTTLYILDASLQPAPIGVPGELYIGGEGLARCYLHSPALTAKHFVPHPWSLVPGALLYRTGDLARYLPDGNLEYLGRTDAQVKIRGFRVELGEIEVALSHHPAVKECVVIVHEDAPEERYLVAYVATEQTDKDIVGEWRGYLKKRLPAYMIPVFFVLLEALPLTPNGKIDRQALPTPKESTEQVQRASLGYSTVIEQILADLWAEVLHVNQIGRQDNFFESGGHSLLATTLVARIRDTFQVDLTVRTLFDAPTISSLALIIENARDEAQPERLLLERRVEAGKPVPLSFAQQRLWLLHQLDPDSTAYNVPLPVRLCGHLRVDLLEQALREMVVRHEALRTLFVSQHDQPVQLVQPTPSLVLPLIDLCAWPPSEREALAGTLIATDLQRPFVLSHDLLLRALLVRLWEDEHILLLTLHHIAFDGWSTQIFLRELTQLYTSFLHGLSSPLPALPVRYADFALWQRELLQGPEYLRLAGYWKEQLHAAPPLLALPTDHPRPTSQSFRGAVEMLVLSPDLTQALQRFCRREGVTLFMGLLTLFSLLLWRSSDQQDLLIGTPIANRTHTQTEGLLGFFANTLVLRIRLQPPLSFRQLLAQVRETALQAYSHQDMPFEQLVEELNPVRQLAYNPLFQVLFSLQTAASPTLSLPDLSVRVEPFEGRSAKFDLSLAVLETAEELHLACEYATDLFEPPTIQRLLQQYRTLLRSALAQPGEAISRLSILPSEELHLLLSQWNQTQTPFPQECIHEQIARQAACTPDAIALVHEQAQLSYRLLDQCSNQLAHYLQRLGVGPEVCVGVCLERSIPLVIALLAVLKAGGAYVPLDASYPKERLAFLIQNAAVSLLLTQEHLLEWFSDTEVTKICLEQKDELIKQESIKQPESGVQPESMAYLIYTSGSTGTPKGVMIAHRNAVNLFTAMDRHLKESTPGIWLALTSISFDISVVELFWTLSRGFRVVLQEKQNVAVNTMRRSTLSKEREEKDYSTAYQIELYGITHLQFTPSLGLILAEEGHALQSFRDLHKITLGGEALPVALASLLKENLSGDIFNMYGPTETTVYSTAYFIDQLKEAMSIGRPVANTEIYILDSHLRPVPIGVPGDLYIGGEGVVRGYSQRPDLTAERFIPHPFSLRPGARLYKTGDLARYFSDGNIEFLGRNDHQVKILGLRIELGEIEATLREHPVVKECVVIAREDMPGDRRLVAYIVSEANGSIVKELRSYLLKKLPEYMVPAAFLLIEALPLTPNGKIDHKALPRPEQSLLSHEKVFVPPRDAWEQQLVRIWEDLFSFRPIGITDNFFELGGHSFSAVRLMTKLQKQFGRKLPLSVLFQNATIEHLAAVLRKFSEDSFSLSVIEIQTQGLRRPFFCIYPPGVDTPYYHSLAFHLPSDQPLYGLQVPDWKQFTRLEEIAAFHLNSLKKIQPQGPFLLGGWSMGGLVAFEVAQQLRLQGEEVALLTLMDTRSPAQGISHGEKTTLPFLALFAQNIGFSEGESISLAKELENGEEEIELCLFLLEKAKSRHLMPFDTELIDIRRFLAIHKWNNQIVQKYTSQPYSGRIMLFKGSEEETESSPNTAWGWENVAKGEIQVYRVPGNHYSMMNEPHIQVLADYLTICL